MSTGPGDVVEVLDALLAARDRERALPPIGSAERPYELVVPGWMEARAIAEGTTIQAVADRTLRYHTRVIVVR